MANIADLKKIDADFFNKFGTVLSVTQETVYGTTEPKLTKTGLPIYKVLAMVDYSAINVKIASATPLVLDQGDVVSFENLAVGVWARNEKSYGFYFTADGVTLKA